MLAASSWLARPARTAAAMARVRPAAPRTSASGLARLRLRVRYSLRLVALVPSRMCVGLVQPAKLHWSEITASSVLDHPSRGITPSADPANERERGSDHQERVFNVELRGLEPLAPV